MAKQNEQIVTPIGVSSYPWLNYPDTRYNSDGEFKVSLILDKEQSTPLQEKINSVLEEAKKLVPKNKKANTHVPFEDELDDQEEPTGNVVFKFKRKHKIKTKDGSIIETFPRVFDSEGQVFGDEQIWGGSQMKVSADLVPYYVPALGIGVSLRLKAAQIIELVSGGQGADANTYGFKQETGYKTTPKVSSEDTNKTNEMEEEDF